ncbi:nucleoid-associated protein [Bosea sp. BH3]|uniref:nucleoid-associated protein n=1 Tax=Bosea sp. BH3 TaxID=2871701 RepID=UPI0021CB2703|nr:nucleoid-associated protein [Bosea sp. BH3]MCU4180177.1 nucleoid-associated protein [Bosea sp. BH3]
MGFLSDEEKDALQIRRMIFHVVGKTLEDPILLAEITPPQHADFFVDRVRSALRGNLFEFRPRSDAERMLREIKGNADAFAEQSQGLAQAFQDQHSKVTSVGVFFVFELGVGGADPIYALIKYDNEDVVRYILRNGDEPQAPRLERFQETFVRKPEAMQKIALVRLDAETGGHLMVRDRSNTAHISDYFERFLKVRRVNSPDEMSGKLVEAFKATFKEHKGGLPEEIQRSGVNRIYEVMRQGHRFDPEDLEPILTAIFGQVAEDAPLRRTLTRNLKQHGVSEETFDINPDRVQKPRRRRLETDEGTQILYDEDHAPSVRPRPDGRKEIVIVTTGVKSDDVDSDTGTRRR